ncbi:MAG: hypothetical protein V4722_06015 [Bacteroidota bacterium]
MLKEDLCRPSEKFLQAIFILSDKTITAFKAETVRRCKDKEKGIAYERFLNWTHPEKELAVFTTYAYADFDIPKQFDCIFNYDNAAIYSHTKFTLTQSIYEGWYPLDSIEHGHKHLCILTFEYEIPDILKRLPYETEKHITYKWDEKKVLGLCQMADIQSIIDKQHKDAELRELHGDNWYDFDDQT